MFQLIFLKKKPSITLGAISLALLIHAQPLQAMDELERDTKEVMTKYDNVLDSVRKTKTASQLILEIEDILNNTRRSEENVYGKMEFIEFLKDLQAAVQDTQGNVSAFAALCKNVRSAGDPATQKLFKFLDNQ